MNYSSKWVESGDKCPRCNGGTEFKVDADGLIEAERCGPCGWVYDFDLMKLTKQGRSPVDEEEK